MKSFRFVSVAVGSLVMLTATADKALAQSTVGLRLFETKCASCHQSSQNKKAPDASRLRKMTPEARVAFVEAKSKEHAQIAKQIQELSGKRDAYIKEEVQKKGLDTNKAFDEAVRKSITEQGAKKGFEFEKK